MTLHGERVAIDFDPEATGALRVVLVGFMGTGKTTLAGRWAESGGPVMWFDSDRAALRRLDARSVQDAFDRLGEPAFREAERAEVLRRARRLDRGVEVWSLGGGALEHADVRSVVADDCVIWLDAPVELLWERVAGSDRPLARDWDAFRELHERRSTRYEQVSSVRVDTSGDLDELGLGRVIADHLPAGWFGSGLAVGAGTLGRACDLAALSDRSIAIVADHAVDHVADDLLARLARDGVGVISDVRLPMGEWNKQLSTVEGLLRRWAADGVHRDTLVVAIGGGTLLDTAGFAASVYQRGVEWVSIPTTLTSQVDAGIGGKTAVNLGVTKNVVGSVHMPRATLIDPKLVDGLPDEVVRDGYVEAAKTALLAGDWLVERVRAVGDDGAGRSPERWHALVEGCAAFKDAVVSEDPFDTDGIRAQLNLGHTLGHAIEAATGGAVSHGAAVAIGVHAVLRLSALVLDAPGSLVADWHDLCCRMGVVTTSPLHWSELEPYLVLDKKHDSLGLGWVLLADVGQPVTGVRVPIEAARRTWEEHVHVDVADVAESASPMRPRVLVLFGANLGELGHREPDIYGTTTLAELVADVEAWGSALGMVTDCRQTDSLERFLHALHEARLRHHAVIVNPGAWTHHERAIHDALAPLAIPRVEVHLTAIDEREEWRRESVIRDAVDHVVTGDGPRGYEQALRWIRAELG